jgi:hypothetical protein
VVVAVILPENRADRLQHLHLCHTVIDDQGKTDRQLQIRRVHVEVDI